MGFDLRRVLAASLLLLASCATSSVEPTNGSQPPPVSGGSGPQSLPGWADEDHLAAFQAYADTCRVARAPAAMRQCERAQEIRRLSRPVTPSAARAFFEAGFTVVQAQPAEGRSPLLTAYFAPEYAARHRRDDRFNVPVLARPADLRRDNGQTVRVLPSGWTEPYPARDVIETVGRAGYQVLAWMTREDLFFMQIQGSGYLTFEDGTRARAAYAADNGHPFVGIARQMEDRGLLPANGASGDAIRAWLASHRDEAANITYLNPRYIFFALDEDDGGQPNGAAGVPLPPRRAIAVDPASWTYGDVVWVRAYSGNLPGARHAYVGLVMALDTGSAIRGPVRADLYIGRGEAAGVEAGSVRHPLQMWRLVPRP